MRRPKPTVLARLRSEAEEGDEVSAEILRDLAAFEATLSPLERRLRDRAEEGDEDAAAVVRERDDARADAIRAANRLSADGGEGNAVNNQLDYGPFPPRTFAEEVRDAILDKRYGVRHTENHRITTVPLSREKDES